MKRFTTVTAAVVALSIGMFVSTRPAVADWGYGYYSRTSPYSSRYYPGYQTGYRRGWYSGYRSGYGNGLYQPYYWNGGYYPQTGYNDGSTTFYLQNGVPAANGAPLFVSPNWLMY
ncbi:MAG: hypothetical protein U0903_16810 [Planctomycetales bacterium]